MNLPLISSYRIDKNGNILDCKIIKKVKIPVTSEFTKIVIKALTGTSVSDALQNATHADNTYELARRK